MKDGEAPAGGTAVVTDAVANIQTNIDANRPELDEVSAEIKEVSAKIDAVSAEIKEVSAKIDAVSAEIKEFSAKIDAVSAKIDAAANEEERQRLIKKETDLMADKEKLRSRQTGLEGVLDGHLKEQSDLRSQLQELRGAGRRGDHGDEGQRQAKVPKNESGSQDCKDDRFAAFLDKANELIDVMKKSTFSEVSLSDLNEAKFNRIVAACNLEIKAVDLVMQSVTAVEHYKWKVLQTETAQMPEILAYLQRRCPCPGNMQLLDRHSYRNSIDPHQCPSFPFKLNGTPCDAGYFEKKFLQTFLAHCGLVLSFEFKKKLSDDIIWQALGELLMASVMSMFAVVHVLTDLKEDYIFLWMDQKTIYTSKAANSGAAQAIINAILEQQSHYIMGGTIPEEVVNAVPVLLREHRSPRGDLVRAGDAMGSDLSTWGEFSWEEDEPYIARMQAQAILSRIPGYTPPACISYIS